MISNLDDRSLTGQPPSGDINIIDSTIYITLTDDAGEPEPGQRTLLIGHITKDD